MKLATQVCGDRVPDELMQRPAQSSDHMLSFRLELSVDSLESKRPGTALDRLATPPRSPHLVQDLILEFERPELLEQVCIGLNLFLCKYQVFFTQIFLTFFIFSIF